MALFDPSGIDNVEIPLGLAMALAQNEEAMHAFTNMTVPEKKEVIEKTHQIQSRQEMKAFVHNMGNIG